MKYVFLDVDGTLFSSSLGGIPESAVKAIKLARKNGHKVLISTARTKGECYNYIGPEYDGFIMSAGGQVMMDSEIIYEYVLDNEVAQYLMAKLTEKNLNYALSTRERTYCDEISYKILSIYYSMDNPDRNLNEKEMEEHSYYPLSEYQGEDIIKIGVYSEGLGLEENMETEMPEGFIIHTSYRNDDLNLVIGEILPDHVSKGDAVRKLIEHYNADMKDTIAIGDSANDISMVETAEVGIAMGNAVDALKEVVDYVTTDILEDGIYNAFKEYDLI